MFLDIIKLSKNTLGVRNSVNIIVYQKALFVTLCVCACMCVHVCVCVCGINVCITLPDQILENLPSKMSKRAKRKD